MLEPPEARTLFASSVLGGDGILTIVGSGGAHTIEFEVAGKSFLLHQNGVVKSFNTSEVKRMRIFAGGGDDTVILGKKLSIAASIEGGSGNDLIGGGAGDDSILGQGGNDTIVGTVGFDYLDAGPGDDEITARDATVHGGSGTDTAFLRYRTIRSGIEKETVAFEGIGPSDKDTIVEADGRLIYNVSVVAPFDTGPYTLKGPAVGRSGLPELKLVLFDTGAATVNSFTVPTDITGSPESGLLLYTSLSGDPKVFVQVIFLPIYG